MGLQHIVQCDICWKGFRLRFLSVQAQNPGQAMIVKEMSKLAGERWKAMSAELRRPYEDKSTISKQEYALLKTLTAEQRVALATHGPAALVCSPSS